MLRARTARCLLFLVALAAPRAATAGERAVDEWAERRVAPQAYVLYCKGLRLQYQKKYAGAIKVYEEALRLDKRSAAILFEIGNCHRLMGKHKKAVEVLQRALKIQPEYGPGHESLAYAYHALRRRADSLRELERAARAAIRPRAHENLLRRLAWIHRRAGDFQKAIEWHEYRLESGYRKRGIYLALGSLHLKTKNYPKALENFRHAIRRSAGATATASDIAKAYDQLSQKERDAAIKHHEAAIARQPDAARREVLAMAYRAAGRRTDMLRQLELAAAADTPRSLKQQEFIAEYYEQLGDYAKAIQWRERILKAHKNPTADAFVRLAGLYVKHQQMPQAIATYRKAMAADPERRELRRRIADAHIGLQQWKQAAAVLEEYLNEKKLASKDAEVIYRLGELYHQAGDAALAARRKKQAFDLVLHAVGKPAKKLTEVQLPLLIAQLYYADEKPEKALDYLIVARQLEPKDTKKILLMAGAYKRVQKWKEAANSFREFLKANPRSLAAAGAFIELAQCQEILGEAGRSAGSRQAAIDILQQVYRTVNSDAARAAVKLELAQIALRRNRPQRAVEHFLDALALNPRRSRYHLGLAQSYQVMADWKRAAAHYESYLSALEKPDAPESALYVYRLGVAQTRSGQADLGRKNKQRAIHILRKALADLEKEKRGTPAYKAELLRDLASLHSGQKDHAKSIQAIRKAIAVAPPGRRTRFRLFLSSILEDDKQYAQCERVLLEEHKRAPDSPDVCNHLGYFYAERGKKLDQAVTLVQKALHYEPLNGAYLDSLGWAYFQQGKVEKARQLLARALQYEEDAVIRDHLGDALLKLGEIDKAREAWTKALAFDPDLPGLRDKLAEHTPKPQPPKPKPKAAPKPKPKPPDKAKSAK